MVGIIKMNLKDTYINMPSPIERVVLGADQNSCCGTCGKGIVNYSFEVGEGIVMSFTII